MESRLDAQELRRVAGDKGDFAALSDYLIGVAARSFAETVSNPA